MTAEFGPETAELLRQQIQDQFCIEGALFNGGPLIPPEAEETLLPQFTALITGMNSEDLPPEQRDRILQALEAARDWTRGFWEQETDISGKVISKCIFQDISLAAWDMRGAVFDSCVFRNAVLPGHLVDVVFQQCSLEQCSLDHAGDAPPRLENVRIDTCTLRDADFSGVATEVFTCTASDLRKVSFRGMRRIRKSGFSGCVFEDVCLEEGFLNNMYFEDIVSASGLSFAGSSMQGAVISGLSLSPGSGNLLKGCDLTCANFTAPVFADSAALEGAVLNRTVLTGGTFSGLTFRRQDLSCVWMNTCHLISCIFEECRLENAKFAGSTLEDTLVQNCLGEQIFAEESTFSRCVFRGSVLDRSIFSRATMTECILDGCSLRQARRHGTVTADCQMKDLDETGIMDTDIPLWDAEHFY